MSNAKRGAFPALITKSQPVAAAASRCIFFHFHNDSTLSSVASGKCHVASCKWLATTEKNKKKTSQTIRKTATLSVCALSWQKRGEVDQRALFPQPPALASSTPSLSLCLVCCACPEINCHIRVPELLPSLPALLSSLLNGFLCALIIVCSNDVCNTHSYTHSHRGSTVYLTCPGALCSYPFLTPLRAATNGYIMRHDLLADIINGRQARNTFSFCRLNALAGSSYCLLLIRSVVQGLIQDAAICWCTMKKKNKYNK